VVDVLYARARRRDSRPTGIGWILHVPQHLRSSVLPVACGRQADRWDGAHRPSSDSAARSRLALRLLPHSQTPGGASRVFEREIRWLRGRDSGGQATGGVAVSSDAGAGPVAKRSWWRLDVFERGGPRLDRAGVFSPRHPVDDRLRTNVPIFSRRVTSWGPSSFHASPGGRHSRRRERVAAGRSSGRPELWPG
jgi:hypothetical protein